MIYAGLGRGGVVGGCPPWCGRGFGVVQDNC